MIESRSDSRLGNAELADLIRALRRGDPGADDALRIDRIRLLEQLKAAVAAAQAVETVAFVDSQRAVHAGKTMTAERAARIERGIASQVALAKKVSPYAGSRFVGWAKVVTTELPETFAALQGGELSEWRATLVARETVFLSREHRAQVDRELGPQLGRLGDRRLAGAARKLAYELDPQGFVERQRQAEKDRRVSLRPAPDTMTRLTALLPLPDGVASIATLGRDADALVAAGDPRSRGQLMADLLTERLTGRSPAEGSPVEVNLVVSTDTLLDGGNEPGYVDGVGPVPASTARDMAAGEHAPVWLRRIFSRPGDGALVAMETRRRLFTPAQRKFVRLRDESCRTPYCDAPIRHTDHVINHDDGGPTSIDNAQGLCAACNFAKQAPGWRARPGPAGTVITTTPTGHTYRSRPPRPPGTGRASPLERHAADVIWAAVA